MATLPSTTTDLSSNSAVPTVLGAKRVFTVEQTFDLSTLLSAVIANADVVNLLTLPANTMILAAGLKIVTAGTKDATTFTLQLRHGTTALSVALDATTINGYANGGATTYALPATVGTSAVHLNLVAVVSGGNAVSTLNPVVKVCVVCVDMS